jgi:hypothetical protein
LCSAVFLQRVCSRLGTVFGVGGAGLAGYKMNKRMGKVEEFAVETLRDGQALHCVIAVSGAS